MRIYFIILNPLWKFAVDVGICQTCSSVVCTDMGNQVIIGFLTISNIEMNFEKSPKLLCNNKHFTIKLQHISVE